MLRYKTKTRPGLVALYDIRPGNGAGPFLQPRSLYGAGQRRTDKPSLQHKTTEHSASTLPHSHHSHALFYAVIHFH